MRDPAARLIDCCMRHYPEVQAVYVFGSRVSAAARPDSDHDVALLLPHQRARQLGSLALSPLATELEWLLGGDVDLVNLRCVGTVFAKEIIATGERIAALDVTAADEFEALTLSFYQKLNDERRAILDDFERSGRAYAV